MTTIAIPEAVLASALVHLRRLIDAESHEEVLAMRDDSAAAWRAAQVVLSQHRMATRAGHPGSVRSTGGSAAPPDIEQHHQR